MIFTTNNGNNTSIAALNSQVTGLKIGGNRNVQTFHNPSASGEIKTIQPIHVEELVTVEPEKANPSVIIRKLLKFDKEGRCTNAFQILSDISILLLAYNSIKSKPGNMTKGTDNETFDGIDRK